MKAKIDMETTSNGTIAQTKADDMPKATPNNDTEM
jgi:hypothetical protein